MFAVAVSLLLLTFVSGTPTSFVGELGKFRLKLSCNHSESCTTELTYVDQTSFQEIVAWKTIPEKPFLRLGNASINQPPIVDGNYQVNEHTSYVSDIMTVDAAINNIGSTSVYIYGQLLQSHSYAAVNTPRSVANYTIRFYLTNKLARQISFDIKISPLINYLEPRTFLTYSSLKGENFYGFGESFTYFNLNGHRVPILVSEQGVGRGEQPITDVLNSDVAQGVGGAWYTTYAPKPIYLTNYNRSFMLDNSEVSFFNLSAASTHNEVEVEVWSLSVQGRLMSADSMLSVIEEITEITGRQRLLPKWTQLGAIVGLEGGTKNVTATVASMYNAGVPLAG